VTGAPPILRAELLSAIPGVRHGFFTRRGGVSGGIYDSLNVGLGSGDDPGAVRENRRLAARALGASSLLTVYQVHSARAVAAEGAWPGEPPQADAIVTRTPGLLVGALAADCAPVLIADTGGGIVGAVHAGWRGALAGVVAAAVDRMVEAGAARERLAAVVGPCIGPASYEVGPEFEDRFLSADPAAGRYFAPGVSRDKRLFDLPGFVLDRLSAAGVRRCVWTGHDTCAQADDFFSNRRAFKRGEPDYGRLLSAIMIEGPRGATR
jgi:YfiH family protein